MSFGRTFFLLAALLAAIPAWAQDRAEVVAACGTPNSTYSAGQNAPLTQDTGGRACNTGSGGTVTPTPNVGTPTQSTVSCGSGNTTLLAAAAAAKFIIIKNPQTASSTVWINFAGAAATAAAPNIDLVPGASISWMPSGFVPTAQLNCITTSGSVSVSLVYK